MDKVIKEYKEYPFWLRLYLGSGWFTATRNELSLMDVAIYRKNVC
jgi:hypothetical protein